MQIEHLILSIIISFVILILVFEILHMLVVKKKEFKIKGESDYWKWGIIYFNPDDPRIIVPKRIPWMGWTMNFAQPSATIIIGGLILFILLIKVLEK
jgi:uncharacterized membrane protein